MGFGPRLTVPCAACGQPVDPLRTAEVAAFEDGIRHFCDEACRRAWDGGARAKLAPDAPPEAAVQPASPPPPDATEDPGDGTGATESAEDRAPVPVLVAITLGTLATFGALAGTSPAIALGRTLCSAAGAAALIARELQARRHPADVVPPSLVVPPLLACVVAVAALAAHDPSVGEATTFAGLVVATTALGIRLVERARRATERVRTRLRAALHGLTWLDGAPPREVSAAEVRPGETVVLTAGERLLVDGRVVSGEASVSPWAFATHEVPRREGDPLVAGATLVRGTLRVVATATGRDRAWARLALDARRRLDVHAALPRLGRRVAERGGVVALLVAALAAAVNGEPPTRVALVALAAHVAVATAAVGSIAAIHVARGLFAALARGVAYRGPAEWDRAAEVSSCVFCARGTLLLGEPQLSDLEPTGALSAERVLSLAAGTQQGSAHPLAAAILHAAAARDVAADAVRSPLAHPGLGVTAIASTGESLAVGNRGLMVRERVSVAVHEPRIAEIESHGRSAQLVALGGRLVGILGLQDALRPGARAAVQHLLDVHVEPVLLSGDARETCEAIGRSLDIEHLRPEVVPAERGQEIQRLEDGGATTAVVGHAGSDESALAAASVPVVLAAAGAGEDWAVVLASDEVRDGAIAIALPHRTHADARTGLVLALAPGVVGALTVAFGLVPPAYAPLAALVGSIAATLHARAFESPPRA